MIQFPRFMPDQNALAVPGIATPFPAGSLVAVRQDDMLAIASPVDGTLICQWARYDAWVMADGTTFASADAAFVVLDAACRHKRPVGETYGATLVAGETIPIGMPVAISRATGQLQRARSDTYTLSFVAGLTTEAVQQGFPTAPARGAVTLEDWTAQTGDAALRVGVPYFLAPSGGLTISPFGVSGACLARVGMGLTPTTLGVAPADPILF